MSGGGGGGGTSTTVQSIPDELKPLASAYTSKAINLSNQAYQPYTGQRYADLNSTQNAGIGMIQDRALNGDATVNAGANYLQNSLTSGPRSATMNPVGGVSAGWNGSNVNSGWNGNSVAAGWNGSNVDAGWNNSSVTARDNPYAMQNNPYLDAMVNKAQGNVLANANMAAARSGSFGNSGIAEQAAKQMSTVATDMYGNAYNSMAQLADANAARNLQAQQFNSGITDANLARNMQAQQFNSGVTDANLARNLQAQQFNSGITDANLARSLQAQQFNSGITDSNIARNLQAQQFNAGLGQDWASRNDSMYNNWNNSNLNAANLGLQYGNTAYTDAAQLMKAGQTMQDQSQNNLDAKYQNYQDAQNLPYKQLAAMSGVFGSNLGSNSTTTSTGGGK